LERITIIGLGLIGGSLGLALKQAKLSNIEIVGHDKEPTASSKARKRGAIDKTEWSILRSVDKASMVIIATPVLTIKEVFKQIAEVLPPGAIVTDTGSTKTQVMEWAEELLPPSVSFIGGHPMAGKESSGIDAASAEIFQGCTYCLIPSANAAPKAVQTVVGLADTVGAKPFFVDPVEHDSLVAAVSHLPIILSSSLVAATTASPGWREMSRLAATGFRDITRLASGDPIMNRDICLTNRDGLVRWIDEYIVELKRYRALVAEGGQELEKEFIRVWEARAKWLNQAKIPREAEGAPVVEIPKASEQMGNLLFGEKLARRGEEIMKNIEKREQDKP